MMLKQKTVYFREEDLPLWEAIENKAQWLHDALSAVPKGFAPLSTDKPAENIRPVIKTPKKAVENTGFISKSFSARKPR